MKGVNIINETFGEFRKGFFSKNIEPKSTKSLYEHDSSLPN